MYREEWLEKSVKLLEEKVFKNPSLMEHPSAMPEKWKITCGWAKGVTDRCMGACVDPVCSKDGTTHLFIIPTQEDSFSVLSTIVHEMIHAIVGIQEGHTGKFRDMALYLQMTKPMTSSHIVPETPVYNVVMEILEIMGPYPHAAMVPKMKPTKPTQWVRWRSRKAPLYTVLANTKQVIEHGIPRDPWGKEMVPCDPGKVFGVQDNRKDKLPDEPV